MRWGILGAALLQLHEGGRELEKLVAEVES